MVDVAAFLVFIVAMIGVDMLVQQGKGARRVSMREAAGWSALWVALALLFNGAL